MATSDALQIAKEVDPNGERTIGVLTKIDLMDEGTTAREVLDNKLLPLRRGYIGVINRSQKDIERKKSIQSTLEDEDKFFSEHQAYRDIADKLGTKYLQKYLNIELTRHIYSKIQSLKNILQKRLKETDGKLEPYRMFENEKQLERTFDHLKEEFRQAFELEIGRSASVFVNVSTLGHGAKIGRLINVLYQDDIKRISKDENELRREIVKAIQNIHGVHQGIFPPDMAFEAVIRLVIGKIFILIYIYENFIFIDKFSEPSMKCIDLVTEELEKLITDCTMKFSSYPTLRFFTLFINMYIL